MKIHTQIYTISYKRQLEYYAHNRNCRVHSGGLCVARATSSRPMKQNVGRQETSMTMFDSAGNSRVRRLLRAAMPFTPPPPEQVF